MPLPQPTADETENDFIIRAHRELMDEFPETDQRNAVVFQAWRQAKGQGELEKKAYALFDDGAFVHKRDVPSFTEHRYTRTLKNRDGSPRLDDKGQPVERLEDYSLDALRQVCERCNYRIADTGNFAALSEGHTPDAREREAGVKPPPILGFSGPFRLGMIGNKEPRWAIFADEHYYRDDADKVRRLPTRSAEVWLAQDMAERFMDPIALLGADAPRLDMGLRFARLESGEEVEKYSAAAVSPGGANTFVPAHVGDKSKERYADPATASAPDSEQESSGMALAPEDVQQIVSAIMETDVMQFCRGLMEAQQGVQGTVPAAPPAADSAMAPPVPAIPAESAPVAPAATAPAAPPPVADAPPAPDAPADDPDKNKDRYAMVEEKQRYARLEHDNRVLNERLAKIENEKRLGERKAQLTSLRQGHVFDLDKEVERCSKLSDDQFVQHCECIVENYQRLPIGATLYVPGSIESEKTERYSRDCAQRAMQRVTEEREKGNHGYSYDQALREVKEKGAKVA